LKNRATSCVASFINGKNRRKFFSTGVNVHIGESGLVSSLNMTANFLSLPIEDCPLALPGSFNAQEAGRTELTPMSRTQANAELSDT
jgi:hypothetical protein